MKYPKIFTSLFLALFIAACDTQQAPLPVEKTTEIKNAPDNPQPALDLSIDNIAIEPQQTNEALFVDENIAMEENSALFKTLRKEKSESTIKLSGKVFTDDAKLEEKDYLNSVEGAQINIEEKLK